MKLLKYLHIKKILFFALLSIINFSYSQSCGKYNLIYRGNFKSNDILISKVQLPTISYLTGIVGENSNLAFKEAIIIKNNFSMEIQSPLTSFVSTKEQLINSFKVKSLKIKILYAENNLLKNKTVNIDWAKISIVKLDDKRISPLYAIDIKNLEID